MAITGAETDGDTISILEPRAASHLRLDPIHPVEPAWGAREQALHHSQVAQVERPNLHTRGTKQTSKQPEEQGGWDGSEKRVDCVYTADLHSPPRAASATRQSRARGCSAPLRRPGTAWS
eukprot:scaffold1614_cov101-Isochrysis_galbana.AAC.2